MFSIPSRPAARIVDIAKYGLAAGSTDLTSTRVEFPRDAGTRTNGERLEVDQAT